MAKSTVYSCDVCGKQKGESNRWWDVWVSPEDPKGLVVGFFDPQAFSSHLLACGEGCTIKLMSRFMNTGTLDGAVEVAQAPVMEGGR